MAKAYTPQVFDALGECLCTVYWYKKDLKSLLVRCGVKPTRVSALNWEYKRAAVSELLDELAAAGAAQTTLVAALIGAVVEQDDSFPRLAGLEDGKRKVEQARIAVRTLRDLIGHQSVVEHAAAARAEKQTEAERTRLERAQRAESLARLKQRFFDLNAMADPRKRGIDFQGWLGDLFALHDLEPRGSFASEGEQIDGSIRVDAQTLLVEARWTKDLVAPEGVRDFIGKLEQKLDNTLGLMVSVEGFTEAAHAKAQGGGRLLAVFIDGQDLVPVLDGLVDLVELLRRKLRHAAEKGKPMYRMGT